MKNLNIMNSYAEELHEISEKCPPEGFKKAEIILKNYSLAEELGFNKDYVDSSDCLDVFAGNKLLQDSIPIAQGYSGHQFGHFNPQLGDGRAILLGEINKMDIQLKGIGQTPYSRRGDGRSALSPVLREYVISEFMHALKIPTTRSLFALKTNEDVLRETILPGGVLTRVAKSHIRIGTFEYARTKNNKVLKTLTDYSIDRHYPDLEQTDNKYLSFFAAVCDKQASLISKWMGLGFVHGVMNTDNMTISGETIDYGPCAFMNTYDPKTVFSSIDHNGRYSYQNQPVILIWNLAKFAETLIPLVDEDEEISVKKLTEVLQLAMPSYQKYFYKEFGEKLGIENIGNDNSKIIDDYLKILHSESIDFTLSFRNLAKIVDQSLTIEDSVFNKSKDFSIWYKSWKKEINVANVSIEMDLKNPCYIPRNHLIEDALINAVDGDMKEINLIAELLKEPFTEKTGFEKYTLAPSSNEQYITYCGT
ncbi:MAG: YdiU family protein [SAR86 cluster bacterium]|uniref:Protein nucleotidyltransferase YdiU n=1 Tax=SAR86 cluster bacterium TaxID=2030880 RepID=A0A520MXC2_9GAMM|nr:MAG: YdiU family protein [SAR86 cluster bacterium]